MRRHYAPSYGPLSGEGARRIGGRWNPPESYSVIYTASSVEAADAEFRRLLATARLPATRPRELATIRVDLSRVLDLRSESTRRALGTQLEDITGEDQTMPRAIGEAAQHLGYEAVVAPSATGIGHVSRCSSPTGQRNPRSRSWRPASTTQTCEQESEARGRAPWGDLRLRPPRCTADAKPGKVAPTWDAGRWSAACQGRSFHSAS